MGFRDILVFVDESAQNGQRLELAIELAQRTDAHLIGLAVTSAVLLPEFSSDFFPQDLISRQRQAARERGERLRQGFEERTAREAISNEWRAVEPLTSAAVVEAVALQARYADIVVVGQTDPDNSEMGLAGDFPGQLALMAGRPVLAVPYAWRAHPIGKRVLVAWNASREATRALHDALPLLRAAQEVRVLALTPKKGGVPAPNDLSGNDIVTHLTRHGVSAQIEHGTLDNTRVGAAILSSATDFGADMMVMGAYGRSRMREIILGGASRSILREMTLPVLMAH
ncbi:MAG: universal stress protein [Nitrococcus mobilis]|nr:universal stress protein [Nitrococcus mobilis]